MLESHINYLILNWILICAGTHKSWVGVKHLCSLQSSGSIWSFGISMKSVFSNFLLLLRVLLARKAKVYKCSWFYREVTIQILRFILWSTYILNGTSCGMVSIRCVINSQHSCVWFIMSFASDHLLYIVFLEHLI